MNLSGSPTPEIILQSINEGVYAVDTTRRIVYWSQSAARITGWPADEILGKHCFDDVLCHIDKDGHRLCGEEHCPLHRSMVTGKGSELPIIVFAQTKAGGRVPLQVAVAPLRDEEGRIVGGVETFRDLSPEIGDIERARRIQMLAMQAELPPDPRVRFVARYVPQDVIGGDCYAIARLDADRIGFLLADVTSTYQVVGRWGWAAGSTDSNRLTSESRKRWTERSDMTAGYIREAVRAIRTMKSLGAKATQMGLEPFYAPDELDRMERDLVARGESVIQNRERREK